MSYFSEAYIANCDARTTDDDWYDRKEGTDTRPVMPRKAVSKRKDRTMKTFTYTPKAIGKLTATDLRQEAAAYIGNAQAASITIYDEAGTQPHAEAAEALYLPAEGRLGIAWGADATWADVRDLESGIEMWLNDDEAWAAAN